LVAQVAQAEDELLVAVVGVNLHEVPEHRPLAHLDEHLRARRAAAVHPGSLPAAQNDDRQYLARHGSTSTRLSAASRAKRGRSARWPAASRTNSPTLTTRGGAPSAASATTSGRRATISRLSSSWSAAGCARRSNMLS